jgi:putative nucleotidyltransferase with HDIG domain
MNSKLPSGRRLKQNILLAVNNLPPMPQVMHKARDMIQNPSSSLKDVGDLIESDQALAMKVLRLANSAYYSRMGKVSSVQEATVVLGLRILSELITVAFMSKVLGSSLKGYDLPAESLWRHSLAVAVGSRIIADKKYAALANEAFSAGLIHDVGKLILDRYILERKEEFLKFFADGGKAFLIAEKEILGFDHAEIASEVCKKWNFPKSISVAVKHHHHPSRLRGNKLAYIVHVADEIAVLSGLDIEGMTLEIDDKSIQVVGIQSNEIELIIDEVVRSVNQITGVTEREHT